MIFLVLALLFPLTIYCLILAVFNRGPHPTCVTGFWDGVGLLFGVSGFLLFGGPAVLANLYEQSRLTALLDPTRHPPGNPVYRILGQLPWSVWASLWAVYFAAVVVAATWFLARRRHTLVIYNISLGQFHAALPQVLDPLGLEWSRSANHVYITLRDRDADTSDLPAGEAVLELDAFPALRHLSLHWHGDLLPVRKDIEAELDRALAQLHTGSSALGSWFLGAAGGLFVVLFFGVLFSVAVIIRAMVR